MTDIVAEIDRVIAQELADREIDRVVDLAHAARAELRVQPWQRDILRQALQPGPGAFTLASLLPRRYRTGGTPR